MGVAMSMKMMTVDSINGDLTKAAAAVAQWFAETNLVYTMQLNIVLQVGMIYVSADGSEAWNQNNDCTRYWCGARIWV
jgi:hypothetical protein